MPGEGEFRGTWWPRSEWLEPIDFHDWCRAVVFENPATKRLNVRVAKNGDDYSDFIGNFEGEWRSPNAGTERQEERRQ